MECRPTGSPLLTWIQFSEAFMAKFIPPSIKGRLRDHFTRLEQSSMSEPKYDTCFHKLSRHATMILPIQEERVWNFVQVLRLPQWIATESFASSGRSFLDIVNHAHTMGELHHEARGGIDKRAHFQGSYSSSQSGDWSFLGRGQHSYQPQGQSC